MVGPAAVAKTLAPNVRARYAAEEPVPKSGPVPFTCYVNLSSRDAGAMNYCRAE